MRAIHASWFYAAVILPGLVGAWGVGIVITRRAPGRAFAAATGAATAAVLAQVGFGLLAYAQGHRPADDFHLFYGFVILFTFSFAYIFRVQMGNRLALSWGLLLLFVMGLGLRAWANVGA